MQRRQFLEAAAGPLASGAVGGAQRRPARGRLKLGTQHGSSEAVLKVLSALGVNHICSELPSKRLDESWSEEGLTRLRERVESHGIKSDMAPLPLSSAYITRSENPNIMLGKSPER